MKAAGVVRSNIGNVSIACFFPKPASPKLKGSKATSGQIGAATHLDLKDGFVKEHHEVPDDAQHLAGVCGIIPLPKVFRHLLHLCSHLLLKLLHTLDLLVVPKGC